MAEEITYRFPRGRGALELAPDHKDTFRLRLAWQRGKTALSLFETTPLRPMAQVVYAGQTFPLSVTGHKRERRDRVALVAERLAGDGRTVLRCDLAVGGREDRLTWEWRVATRAGARRRLTRGTGDVTLCLPLTPGRTQILSLPSATRPGLVLQRNGVAVTVVSHGLARLVVDEQAVRLHLPGALLDGGVLARLETWVAPGADEREARRALLGHLAGVADRAQLPASGTVSLADRAERSASALMAPEAADKRGLDRLVLRASPSSPDLHQNGDGADAALAACALYNRYRFTGEDAERRRALLLARGACEFQIVDEASTHRGALWDALRGQERFGDAAGGRTLSVATTARAAFGLFWMHARFGQEIMARTALASAQWLLLKMDPRGLYAGERYEEDGSAVPGGSAWAAAEALRPLVEAFRRTGNEVFLKAALRVVKALREGMDVPPLALEDAPTGLLAAAVEGVLYVSRESEDEQMIALAKTLGEALRARRAPNGALHETGAPSLPATLAAARAALALARVDGDAAWPLLALRALRATEEMAAQGAPLRPADHAALCALPAELLLTLAACPGGHAAGSVADRDALTLTRAWQVFEPDKTTRDFVRVTTADGQAPVDHLALVSPHSLQVLIVALARPDVTEAVVLKNGRAPFLKNLLTGDHGQQAKLAPSATPRRPPSASSSPTRKPRTYYQPDLPRREAGPPPGPRIGPGGRSGAGAHSWPAWPSALRFW